MLTGTLLVKVVWSLEIVTAIGITGGTTTLDWAAEPDLEVCVMSSAALLPPVVCTGSSSSLLVVESRGSRFVGSGLVGDGFVGDGLVGDRSVDSEPVGDEFVGTKIVPSACEVCASGRVICVSRLV